MMEIITPLTTLKSKADALVFAINKTCDTGSFDKAKVDEIYDYIVSKVNLPDVEQDTNAGYLEVLNGMMARYGSMIEGLQRNG